MGGRVVKRVRLVEDDEAIAEVAGPILHGSDQAVDRVATVADALVHVPGAHPPAVVPLALALPKPSGTSFMWARRQCDRLASVPDLGLTARPHQERDDLVPDVALVKPFENDGACAVEDRRAQTPGPSPVGAASARLWSDHDR